MSESLEDKAKRLGWSPEFKAGVEKAQRDMKASPLAGMSQAQIRAHNRRARLAQDAREQGSRQAATMASKAKRGF